MNSKKTLTILIIILIAAVAVWAIYLLGKAGEQSEPLPPQPVVNTGKYTPKLNNTLETSVTVVNPTENAPQQ
jgi:hypothetical protein